MNIIMPASATVSEPKILTVYNENISIISVNRPTLKLKKTNLFHQKITMHDHLISYTFND